MLFNLPQTKKDQVVNVLYHAMWVSAGGIMAMDPLLQVSKNTDDCLAFVEQQLTTLNQGK